jgi:glycosyltransferase involved in cell wall biosynthesis
VQNNGPLRVGYVVKRYPRYSETFIVAEIAAHEAAGLEIEVFSLFPPNDAHFQDGISRVRAPVRYIPSVGMKANDLWAALEDAGASLPGFWSELELSRGETAFSVHGAAVLATEVRRRGIHHLHAHFATGTATVARLASRFAKVPFTFTAHAKDIFHHTVQPDDLRRKLEEAAAVVTVSDYNREYLTRTYGSAAARVRRVYNGLDLEEFRYRAPDERPPRIAGVGRLVEKKGFADLIEACAILHDRGLPFRCDIVGTGPLELSLHALVQRHGLQGRVHLLGPRPRNEVIDHIRSAAVLAAPCVVAEDGDRDGMPTVLLEAMALGTPCVATDVTAIPELLAPGGAGVVVPAHAPWELAAMLERLLTDPAVRVRIATQARRRVEAEFDVRRTAEDLRALFHGGSPVQDLVAEAVG